MRNHLTAATARIPRDPRGRAERVQGRAGSCRWRAGTSQRHERGPFGILTLDGRRTRALRWVQQVQDATRTPISNRKRKGRRQLEQRQQALSLVVDALSLLDLSGSPVNRKRRAERLVSDAAAAQRSAAKLAGVRLR